jgi:hypothetical protein
MARPLGHHLSAETRARLSNSAQKYWGGPEGTERRLMMFLAAGEMPFDEFVGRLAGIREIAPAVAEAPEPDVRRVWALMMELRTEILALLHDQGPNVPAPGKLRHPPSGAAVHHSHEHGGYGDNSTWTHDHEHSHPPGTNTHSPSSPGHSHPGGGT